MSVAGKAGVESGFAGDCFFGFLGRVACFAMISRVRERIFEGRKVYHRGLRGITS